MIKQNDKEPRIESNLDFKKHDWYFEGLNNVLLDFIDKYNKALLQRIKPDEVYLALNSIFLWSSDQFEAIGEVDELKKDLNDIKSKVINGEKGTLALMYDVFLKFNSLLSKTENKPKVKITREDEYDKFWRTEENAGLREMKKAFFDSFMLPED